MKRSPMAWGTVLPYSRHEKSMAWPNIEMCLSSTFSVNRFFIDLFGLKADSGLDRESARQLDLKPQSKAVVQLQA